MFTVYTILEELNFASVVFDFVCYIVCEKQGIIVELTTHWFKRP